MPTNEKSPSIGATVYAALNANNILFKSGTQESLNKYMKGSGDAKAGKAEEGAFYLTTDTHRLYIGRKETETTNIVPVPVNQGIVTLSNIDDLKNIQANPGEFYYVGGTSNILCIYNGQEWVQINPDTDTDTSINTFSSTASKSTDSTKVTVTHSITEKDINGTAVGTAKDASVTFVKGQGISLDVNSNEITISTPLEMTVESAKDGSGVAIANTVAVELQDSQAKTPIDSFKVTGGKYTTVTPDNDNGGFTIASTFDISDNSSFTYDTNGTLKINLLDGNADPLATITGPTLTYSYDGDDEVHTFNTPLDVYTKGQIDSKLRSLNAVEYKGTVSSNLAYSNLTSDSSYKIGWAYLVSGTESITFVSSVNSGIAATSTANPGDLLIANGQENTTTGFIKSNTLFWDYIPSGDEVDTQYTFSHAAGTNGIVSLKLVDSNSTSSGEVKLNAKTEVTNNNPLLTITAGTDGVDFSHNIPSDFQATNTLKTSGNDVENNVTSLTVVSNVSRDSRGHVLDYTLQKYDLKTYTQNVNDSNGSPVKTVTESDNTITIANGLYDGTGTLVSNRGYSIASSTLDLVASTDGTRMDINLTWGTF